MPNTLSAQTSERPRAKDLGVLVGKFTPGRLNAITDVPGVRVGHATVVRGDSIRTGVTVIFPHEGNLFESRVPAAIVVGNGFGKFVGSTQVAELGELETPIALTSTLSVWRVAESVAHWMLAQPGMGRVTSINPVVGETNDGLVLNAARSMPITDDDVVHALESSSGGPVAEGAVGAGTGTVAFEWKGGIGTSSRLVPPGPWMVGVLVQSNFGAWRDLLVQGIPVGRELGRGGTTPNVNKGSTGSIVIVVATDAPLSDRNLRRLAARALFGLGRTGSCGVNGSGDYVIAFSTSSHVRRNSSPGVTHAPPKLITSQELGNELASTLFEPTADATAEAIYNSLFRSTTQTGALATVNAIPIDEVRAILARFNSSER